MSSTTQNLCSFCGCPLGLHCRHCPHCGQPSLFPNVKAAQADPERQALEARYQNARDDAIAQQSDTILDMFETAVAQRSKAVLNRPLPDVLRMANSSSELYGGFYRSMRAGTRLPNPESPWDTMRESVDAALFPSYHQDIFFAALTLDEAGLDHYGDCSVILREECVAHRATVFEENSFVFMEKRNIGRTQAVPPGYRAVWQDRGRLSVAKLANKIDQQTQPGAFAALLLKNGHGTGEKDVFVEVHICGTMSVCSMEKVSVKKSHKKSRKVLFKQLGKQLKKQNIPLEVR